MLVAFILGMNVSGFAQSEEKSAVEKVTKVIANKTKKASSGTTYGLIKETKNEAIVNTPIGEFTVEKKDGWYSLFGMSAKIESKKGNIYIIRSSLGKFKVDIKKGIIVKLQ